MTKKKKQPVLVVLAVLIVLLASVTAGLCVALFTRYTWVAGGIREKGNSRLDLRGETISLSDFEKLTQAFPGREILWDVPLQSGSVASDASQVTLLNPSPSDWEALELMENLTFLDATGCRDYDRLMDFQARHPQCQVRYSVLLGGREYPNDAQTVTLSGADAAQAELLSYLPRLTQVEFTISAPTEAEMDDLAAAFPDVFFRWPIPVGDATVDSAAETLDLHGQKLTGEEIARLVSRMPNLTQVNLLGCPLEDSQVLRLAQAYPQVHFLWEIHFGDQTFRTDAQELDISGWQVEDAQTVEQFLPCFWGLKRVIMCGCGLDNETMDALNRKYEDIRFVWSVRIKDVDIRTDAKWFYPFKYQQDMVVVEEDLYPLRYCTDMEAIDIGHMTQVKTCEWVRYMPNLKYLIIGETGIHDLSPLTNLKKLSYLEMFTIPVEDYSPLLACTGLEDLNLGLTYGEPDVIAEITWLKNLWWCDANGANNSQRREAVARMCENLKDTKIAIYVDHPTAGGWRNLPNYFKMRDLMGMFYLT